MTWATFLILQIVFCCVFSQDLERDGEKENIEYLTVDQKHPDSWTQKWRQNQEDSDTGFFKRFKLGQELETTTGKPKNNPYAEQYGPMW